MRCPYCASEVPQAAVVCPHCTHDFYLFKPLLERLEQLETHLLEQAQAGIVTHEARIAALESELAVLKTAQPAAPGVAVAAPLSLLGCGGGDDTSSGTASTASDGGSKQRVIVQASNGAFSPQAIYAKASPGVVTIRSVFGGGGAPSLLGGKPSAGQGSGFVDRWHRVASCFSVGLG